VIDRLPAGALSAGAMAVAWTGPEPIRMAPATPAATATAPMRVRVKFCAGMEGFMNLILADSRQLWLTVRL
jgi:hypothetical protein